MGAAAGRSAAVASGLPLRCCETPSAARELHTAASHLSPSFLSPIPFLPTEVSLPVCFFTSRSSKTFTHICYVTYYSAQFLVKLQAWFSLCLCLSPWPWGFSLGPHRLYCPVTLDRGADTALEMTYGSNLRPRPMAPAPKRLAPCVGAGSVGSPTTQVQGSVQTM